MNLPLAPLIAAVAGGLAALGVAMIPVPALEALVMDSGLPSVLSMAEPPLGATARIAVALGTGAFVAAFMWLSAFILLGTRGLGIGKAEAAPEGDPEDAPIPVIRRADAHPDAPPRPPLLATRDLGKPFLEVRAAPDVKPAVEEPVDFDAIFPPRPISAPAPAAAPAQVMEAPEIHAAVPSIRAPVPAVPVEILDSLDRVAPIVEPVQEFSALPPPEQELPADFNQPLSAFDPEAIPAVPRSAPVPLAPLRRTPRPSVFDETERFEIFELTPPVRKMAPQPAPGPMAESIVRPETDASIHALLERLERGVTNKGLARHEPTPREAERGLEEALVTLRNLARRTA